LRDESMPEIWYTPGRSPSSRNRFMTMLSTGQYNENAIRADVPEARADLLHAIYDRILVKGRSIVAARLTPAAYSNGLALALPQVVMARPEGDGHALTTYRMPIEGREEWLAAAGVRSA
jgi:hypothetical protein